MTERFEFIDAEYAAYQESGDKHVPSIVMMCRWMEVSRSGFYDWLECPGISDREKARDTQAVRE